MYYSDKIKNSSESGNVLFLILIAVALFAALSYAVSLSSRSGSGSADSESALIASSEVVQYGSALENAMTYLQVSKRCAVEDMSFERAPFDGSDVDYVNGSAPADFSCHIFHPDGGRVAAVQPPRNANDGRDWAYIEVLVHEIGADQTLGCGTGCREVALVLGGLKQSTCEKINRRFTNSTAIPVQDDGSAYESLKYTGSFTTGDNIDGGAAGYSQLCTEDAAGTYYYYHVLFPR